MLRFLLPNVPMEDEDENENEAERFCIRQLMRYLMNTKHFFLAFLFFFFLAFSSSFFSNFLSFVPSVLYPIQLSSKYFK